MQDAGKIGFGALVQNQPARLIDSGLPLDKS